MGRRRRDNASERARDWLLRAVKSWSAGLGFTRIHPTRVRSCCSAGPTVSFCSFDCGDDQPNFPFFSTEFSCLVLVYEDQNVAAYGQR
jgi:hypothetical protein